MQPNDAKTTRGVFYTKEKVILNRSFEQLHDVGMYHRCVEDNGNYKKERESHFKVS